MWVDAFIQLPDDAPNSGKRVYTREKAVDIGDESLTVHKHVFDVDNLAAAGDPVFLEEDSGNSNPVLLVAGIDKDGNRHVLPVVPYYGGRFAVPVTAFDSNSDVPRPFKILNDKLLVGGPAQLADNGPVNQQPVPIVLDYSRLSGQTATPAIIDTSIGAAGIVQKFALQVVDDGGIGTTWDVRVEGTVDNITWDELFRHTTTDGSGKIKWLKDAPVIAWRIRVDAVTIGSGGTGAINMRVVATQI